MSTPLPLSLARLPTPLQRLDRLSEAWGGDLWVKRDDLTGLGLSGNKVRKLEWLLAAARDHGATAVVTCGGLQSNHCRATAVACRQLGLEPVLLLRGEDPPEADGNVLLDRLLGARIHFCTPEVYRSDRDGRMQALAEELGREGHVAYVIPEGGSNGLGALAFARAAAEAREQAAAPFDQVVVAVGSGGTLAGLALAPGLGPVRGVAVCDDAPTFRARVAAIAADAAPHGLGPLPAAGESWDVVEGYQGPAYAVATEPVWEVIRTVARLEGLFLDPVYTGKAMWAVREALRDGRWGPRVLFWHTGGAFGLFGRGAEALAGCE